MTDIGKRKGENGEKWAIPDWIPLQPHPLSIAITTPTTTIASQRSLLPTSQFSFLLSLDSHLRRGATRAQEVTPHRWAA